MGQTLTSEKIPIDFILDLGSNVGLAIKVENDGWSCEDHD